MASHFLKLALAAALLATPVAIERAAADTVVLVGVGEVTVMSTQVTVVSVNPDTRELIVKAQNGNQFAYQIAPEVGPLTNIVPNNHLDVSVVPGAVTDLEKADSGTRGVLARNTVDAEIFSKLPQGFFGTSVVENVMLVDVNAAQRTIMFEGADGLVRTMQAADDEVAGDLAQVAPGDLCQVTYFEAMAVKVLP